MTEINSTVEIELNDTNREVNAKVMDALSEELASVGIDASRYSILEMYLDGYGECNIELIPNDD